MSSNRRIFEKTIFELMSSLNRVKIIKLLRKILENLISQSKKNATACYMTSRADELFLRNIKVMGRSY